MSITEKEIQEKYEKITRTLIAKKLSVTTMESCTSGFIASLLTDTEGSSAIFRGAFVTYSNEAKIMQGVPADTIKEFGVYSEETACAMADAACRAYSADIAIGVTGTMGNIDPANNDSTPGEVFFAIKYLGETTVKSVTVSSRESRHAYKVAVSGLIGDELLKIIG